MTNYETGKALYQTVWKGPTGYLPDSREPARDAVGLFVVTDRHSFLQPLRPPTFQHSTYGSQRSAEASLRTKT